jgi:guanylate kinase
MERRLTRKGILFVLIGPSGSGKSTFCARLVKEFRKELHYSISVTSRAPRANEVPGKSYHFVSREEFLAIRERGEFFEWEENGIAMGHDLLFQIDIRGALSMKRAYPDNTVAIFILPPSFDALKDRVLGRSSIEPEELRRRFATARQEYDALLELRNDPGKIDYLVLNNELEETYDNVRSIVVAERSKYLRIEPQAVSQFCEVNDDGV